MTVTYRIHWQRGLWRIADGPHAHPAAYLQLEHAIRYLRDCRCPNEATRVRFLVTDRAGRTVTRGEERQPLNHARPLA